MLGIVVMEKLMYVLRNIFTGQFFLNLQHSSTKNKITVLNALHLPNNIKIMIKKANFKVKGLLLALGIFSIMSFSQCKKEDLVGKPSNELLSSMPAGVKLAALSSDGITSSSYYLVNALPSGYVKDGSRDYTTYVQAAVSKYSNVVFPAFPILVNDNGIVIGSNKTITFPQGSEIRLKPSSNTKYDILRISGSTNVTLYNPVIVGDRYSHLGTEGEWGMGIGIRGSSNITLYSPKVTDCWGDGIYIGQLYGRENCKNIVIKDAYLRKNRRDGISIISVDGLLIDNIYAGYTDGTKPWTGINFEANNPLCEFKNVRINNPFTENNGSRGIQIHGTHMLDYTNKNVDITIVNHVDIGSKDNSFKMNFNSASGTVAKLYGKLNIVNPTWHKVANNVPLNLSSTNQLNFKTSISSPEVMYMNGYILNYSEAYALLIKQASRTSLTITDFLETSLIEPVEEIVNEIIGQPVADVVFAVNSGGGAFKASNGITYASDKNYSGGATYYNDNSISNTIDDGLYQSERKGNFEYVIPLSNGTYEITFKLAEIYHNRTEGRQFDILGEGVALVSNLDIFAEAGKNTAYDLKRRITLNDGVLNLNFKTDINNAKISAFHIVKE